MTKKKPKAPQFVSPARRRPPADDPPIIVQNEVRCLACGERIFSRHRHDFVRCDCGNVAVDGGMSYLRRSGGERGYTELSMSLPTSVVQAMRMAVKESVASGRNDLGVALAVMRALRDGGFIKEKRKSDGDAKRL